MKGVNDNDTMEDILRLENGHYKLATPPYEAAAYCFLKGKVMA